jgi:hypothetical protein
LPLKEGIGGESRGDKRGETEGDFMDNSITLKPSFLIHGGSTLLLLDSKAYKHFDNTLCHLKESEPIPLIRKEIVKRNFSG